MSRISVRRFRRWRRTRASISSAARKSRTSKENKGIISPMSVDNSRIAKNTVYLYIRMIFVLGANFFAVRVLLEALEK